ncbi:MAG: leucine-rich repeat domain-containing protein [Bacteroidaceae bacterium]|nr:leucine-rich repeat domain-containing protein [Bacteroidaceae bacterium]
MKTIKKLLITVAVLLCSVTANAYDFEVDGIYYNILSASDLTVEVTRGHYYYIGEVIIPSTVTYKSRTLSVISIGNRAFSPCDDLTSVTIPNSVTTIEEYAFDECTSIRDLRIEDGSNILSCNRYVFQYCPLKTLYLGRDLQNPLYIFSYKATLTSVTIGNSVTTIGKYEFSGCSGLTSITIPNSVTTIEKYAFSECTGLTSITIGNSVTTIGEEAFGSCTGLTSINLLGETPPSVGNNNFTENDYVNITLYVPSGSLETYQNADTWENFWDIREMGTTETPEVEVKKCATPVITYNNSGLDITSETDDAEIHTNITCNDVGSYNGSRIDLSETYSITTYATKSGYQNSETVTATLCWIAVSGGSEENCIIEVEAMPVLITCDNGTIIICGGEDGAEVVVYTTSGVAVGNDIITNGNATVSTGLTKGETAIINIAGKGIKVVMQ